MCNNESNGVWPTGSITGNWDDMDADLDAEVTTGKTFMDAQVKAARTVRPRRTFGRAHAMPAPVKATWRELNKEVCAWVDENAAKGNNFALNMRANLARFGSLTPNMVTAITRSIERMAPPAGRYTNLPPMPAQTGGMDLSSLPAGRYAVPDGDTRLKIKIDRPTEGKWAGYIFVKDGADYGHGKKYGMQGPGRLYNGAIQTELKAVIADPKAAMAAYGHLVGQCGACGRKLEDPVSIERGIGPVCAENMGWG